MYLAEKIYRLVKKLTEKLTGTPSFPGGRRATVTPGGKGTHEVSAPLPTLNGPRDGSRMTL
jgi:hypothetical protein